MLPLLASFAEGMGPNFLARVKQSLVLRRLLRVNSQILLLFAIASVLCLASRTARADDSTSSKTVIREGSLSPVFWKPEYRRYTVVDGVATGAGITAFIVSRTIGPPENGPQGGIGFDEAARDALRASSYQGRLFAADLSDVLLGLSVSYALLGDPLVNATWLRQSSDAAEQIFLLNLEVLAVTLGVQETFANAIGRERPYGRTCGTDDLSEDDHHCTGSGRYRSMFSGHTAVPFSMAAATCTHHLYLPLSGGSSHAWIPCTTGFLAAAASGTMRIVADYHYASDVLIGAAVGTSLGFAIPLLHYTTGSAPLSTQVGAYRFHVTPTWGGLQIYGVMP